MPGSADISFASPGEVRSPLKAAGRENGVPAAPTGRGRVDIIDIRGAAVEINLKDDILSLFSPKEGPRMLPTLLLYDEKGLQLFEEVGSATTSATP